MDPESSALPADLGMEFQYQVITCAAARLSQNPHVKDFVIYSNIDEATPADDLILKIWFKEKEHPYVYMGQVKHKLEKNIDISDTPAQSNVSRYLEIYKKIMASKDVFTFLSDVHLLPDGDNIKFWLYCNKNVENINVYKKTTFLFQCDFSEIVCAHRTIIPFETIEGCCYKLSLPSIQTYPNISLVSSEEYEKFFNNFYLILNQPGIDKIDEDIKKFCELPESRTMYRYIHEYFNNSELCRNGLSKRSFQTELLKIHLSDYIPSFTRTIGIGGEEANHFNELVNASNMTLVDNMENVENIVYSCFLRRVDQVLSKMFAWNDIVSKNGQLINGATSKEFQEYAEKKRSRQWITEPETINSLLTELWVYDELPLILKTDSELKTVLSKYKHLNKKFIVIGDVKAKIRELSSVFTRIFTNIGDIQNISQRNNFLGSIKVSLQGKTPVPLFDIISKDELAMKELNWSKILSLIKKRKAYLQETFLHKSDSIVFIIEDENSHKECSIDQISPKNNENIQIHCRNVKENLTVIEESIRNNSKFENYTTCYLRLCQGKLEFLGENILKLGNYLVDENDDGIYIDDMNQEVLPIIGRKLYGKPFIYLPRYLSKTKILNSLENKGCIYFLSGDISSLETQETIFDGSTEIDQNIDQNIWINAGTDSIEKYWTKFATCQRPLFHVKVVDGCLKMLDYKNYNLEVDFLYDEAPFEEKDFFKVTNDSKVTIIVGDQGAGKTTFLDALSLFSNEKDYVLFCNLGDYEKELKGRNKKLLDSPLDYIFNKFESSSFRKLLNPVCNLHKTTGRLVIFIDSLDKVLPLCEDAILVVIKRIIEYNVRVIITSRFLTQAFLINNLLINNIQVRSLKVCDLREEDCKVYFQLKSVLDFNADEIEKDFLINPSYLSYLHFHHQKSPLDFGQADKFDICNLIILKIIEDYYRKINFEYELTEESEAQNEEVLNSHRLMAMVAHFGKYFVIRNCNIKEPAYNKLVRTFKQLHIKLGIVRDFKDDCPVFVNNIFVQFLVKEWFNKRRGKLNVELKKAHHNFIKKYY